MTDPVGEPAAAVTVAASWTDWENVDGEGLATRVVPVSAVTCTEMVVEAVRPNASVAVTSNESRPTKSLSGVYVYEPSAWMVTSPWAGSVAEVRVRPTPDEPVSAPGASTVLGVW